MNEDGRNCEPEFQDNDCESNELTVKLTLDNDEELECIVLTILNAGDQQYIALLPIADDDNDEEDSDVFIYRFSEIDGEPHLENIKDDHEYDLAADAFAEWLQSQEYDDELSDED